jgi:hypothetical protein
MHISTGRSEGRYEGVHGEAKGLLAGQIITLEEQLTFKTFAQELNVFE